MLGATIVKTIDQEPDKRSFQEYNRTVKHYWSKGSLQKCKFCWGGWGIFPDAIAQRQDFQAASPEKV